MAKVTARLNTPISESTHFFIQSFSSFLNCKHNIRVAFKSIILQHSSIVNDYILYSVFLSQFYNNNNNNKHDNVYGACHHGRAIARVHPVHLMNVEWR